MTHVLQDEFDDPGDVVDPNAVKRDRWDRPLLPPVNLALARAEGDVRPFTRCTTFASALGDESNLARWKMRMVAKGMAEREDLRLLAKAADVTDKKDLDEVAEAAFEIAGGNIGRRLGTAFHKFSEILDRGGREDDVDPEFLPHVRAYTKMLDDYGITIMGDYIERLCAWEKFSVAGSFDNIVMYRRPGEDVERPTVLDKKGGADLSYGWLKIAVQLLCYVSADAIWDQENYRWLPMPDGLRQDIALVAHVPTGKRGEETVCDLYEIDLLPAMDAVRVSYEAREWLKTRGIATKLKSEQWSADLQSVQILEPAKPLSAQITEKVLAGNEAAKSAPKRRAPRKKAEPVVETLEFAELDEEVAAAEAAPVAFNPTDPNWPWPWSRPEETLVDVTADSSDSEAIIEADVSLVEEFDDPFAEVVEVDLELAVTPEEKFAALIRGAATPAELSQIRKEAIEEEAWTDNLLQLGMARLAELKK